MRFILAIFVLIPLAVAVLGTVLVVLILFDHGVASGLVSALVIFGALTIILAYMAFRILRRPRLELTPGVRAPRSTNSLIVGLVFVHTVALVVVAFGLSFGTFSVKNLIGPFCLVLGLVPLCLGSGLLLSTRYKIQRGEEVPLVQIEDLKVIIAARQKAGRILFPSTLLAILIVIWAYYSLDGARYFSLLDLGGGAFFIASGSVALILDNYRFRMIYDYAQESLSSSVRP